MKIFKIEYDENRFKTLILFGIKIRLSKERRRIFRIKNEILKKIEPELNKIYALDGIQWQLLLLRRAIADPKGLGFLELLMENAHVAQEHKIIFQNLTTSDICIDGGANIGIFSDICLHQGGIVYSFEPDKMAFQVLSEKYKDVSNIYIYNEAIWIEDCMMDFYDCENDQYNYLDYSQGKSLIKNNLTNGLKHTTKHSVKSIDFVRFIKEKFINNNLQIYLLKLDIEGAEFEVLTKLIELDYHKHIRYILVETHENNIDNGSEKLEKLKKEIDKKNIENIWLDWY